MRQGLASLVLCLASGVALAQEAPAPATASAAPAVPAASTAFLEQFDRAVADVVDHARPPVVRDAEVVRRAGVAPACRPPVPLQRLDVVPRHPDAQIGREGEEFLRFGIPGLGSLMVDAAFARDYPVVQACAIVFLVIVLSVNLAVDLVCTSLDPRRSR